MVSESRQEVIRHMLRVNVLKPGIMVKFSGQRDSRSARKIMEIKRDGDSISVIGRKLAWHYAVKEWVEEPYISENNIMKLSSVFYENNWVKISDFKLPKDDPMFLRYVEI